MANEPDKKGTLIDLAEDYAFWHHHFHKVGITPLYQRILGQKEEKLVTFVLDNFNG